LSSSTVQAHTGFWGRARGAGLTHAGGMPSFRIRRLRPALSRGWSLTPR